MATGCKELTHWKRPWCSERLNAGGEADDRGWDAWMALLTLWTWIWASSMSWWWTGKTDLLQFRGSQRVGHGWVTELNWVCMSFPGGPDGGESVCNAGDLGSIPGLGRSSGGGHGNPLHYSCLKNPHGQRGWQAMVHGVAKSRTQQSN